MAKIVVRVMLSAQGYELLLNQFVDIKPSIGGSWKSSLIWAFMNSNFKTRQIHGPKDGFMDSICNAWDVVSFFLSIDAHLQMKNYCGNL